MNLLEKLQNNSTIKETATLDESKFFDKEFSPTFAPAINIALSGDVDGGLTSGLTMWAGKSRMFKTLFSLVLIKAYLTKYPDAVVLFYDSEFGANKKYFDSMKIDSKRVLHTPIVNIEKLKFDIMNQIENIDRKDKVVIFVDSIGNLASKKEAEDALAEKGVQDMSRPKQMKSLFRMVTPYLTLKDIPMVVVNHTYDSMDLYPTQIVSGGTGSFYSADNIFILGRQQEKDTKGLTGYNFVINVEKSRFVKEKSKILISVSFDKGINKWSGLLDLATELKFLVKTKDGVATAYQVVDQETGEILEKKYKVKDTDTAAFWEPILADEKFKQAVKTKFQLSENSLIQDEEDEEAAVTEEI